MPKKVLIFQVSLFKHHLIKPSLMLNLNYVPWEFLGGSVVRTQHFHCCGPGSIPGRGTKDPTSHKARPPKNYVPLLFFFITLFNISSKHFSILYLRVISLTSTHILSSIRIATLSVLLTNIHPEPGVIAM